MTRNKFHKLLTFIALIVITPLWSASARINTVVIDPGHGGKDKGANWYGVYEKTLNLDVAFRLEKLLKAQGYRTVLTRRSDKFVTLDGRAAIANKYSNAVFVSIHFNAHRDRSITGTETFYYSSKGKTLASRIQSRMGTRIKTRNRGIKRKPFAVLTRTKPVAALVECGFISNSWERKRSNTTWLRQALAQAISEGIRNYTGSPR